MPSKTVVHRLIVHARGHICGICGVDLSGIVGLAEPGDWVARTDFTGPLELPPSFYRIGVNNKEECCTGGIVTQNPGGPGFPDTSAPGVSCRCWLNSPEPVGLPLTGNNGQAYFTEDTNMVFYFADSLVNPFHPHFCEGNRRTNKCPAGIDPRPMLRVIGMTARQCK